MLLRRAGRRRRRRKGSIWIRAKFPETVVVVADVVAAVVVAAAAILVHLACRSCRTSVGQERHDRHSIRVPGDFATGRRISSYARACSSDTRQVRDIVVVFETIIEWRRMRKAVHGDLRLWVGERRALVLVRWRRAAGREPARVWTSRARRTSGTRRATRGRPVLVRRWRLLAGSAVRRSINGDERAVADRAGLAGG